MSASGGLGVAFEAMADHAQPSSQSGTIEALLASVRVLPVLTVDGPRQAVAVARALAEGGLKTIEIALRTARSLAAIEAVVEALPEVVVGAGTVESPDRWRAAAEAGARFAVSPGLTPRLAAAADEASIPLMPGVATVSEAMVARDHGWRVLKLFPAAALGGPALLRAFSGPLPDLSFCPTGGIDSVSYRSYLEQPNVLLVGGSWMVPPGALSGGDWAEIRQRAQELSP